MEVRGILKGLVGIIMIGCFFYQMWPLFEEFLSELKTVTVSYKEKYAVEFPNFAFCDSTAFTENIGIIANFTLYNSSTFNVEGEVSMVNSLIHDLTGTYTVQYFPTTCNGYCKLYEFHGEHRVGTTIVFKMPLNRSYDVFLLECGTKLSLISQSIVQPQPTLTVAQDTQLFISKTIAKTRDKTCREITISEKMDCIIDKVQQNLISVGGNYCLPFYYYDLFPNLLSEFGQCKDDSIFALAIHDIIWDRIDRYAKEGCPSLCENVEYDIRVSKLGKNSKVNGKKTVLYAKYASPKVKIEEEYTLMGTNAIISATGGSLGLFLGFSCYGAIWDIFEMLEKGWQWLKEKMNCAPA